MQKFLGRQKRLPRRVGGDLAGRRIDRRARDRRPARASIGCTTCVYRSTRAMLGGVALRSSRALTSRAASLASRAAASLCIAAASLPPLNTTRLPYRGVLLDFTVEEPPPDFAERLAPSMERWQAEGVKSAMLKLPIEHAALATAAAEQGFSFHHVPLDADGRCVVLKKWLQPLLEDKIPPFATHQVGIAGLCIDNAGRLLVVKEWSDVEGGGREPSKQWKLPVS